MMTTDLAPYALDKADMEEDGDEYFSRPFTLVDTRGDVWDAATNRKWFVAIKGKGQYPRWSGDINNLNTMLGLIQAEPITSRWVPVAKLAEWAQGEGLGRILGAVVSLDKVAKLLGLGKGKLQVWDSTTVTQNQPSVGMDRAGLRIILMGHDLPKIEKGTPIRPFEATDEVEREGFALAMSLDDDE